MSRFWLTYKSRNRLVGIVILDSSHLIHARMRAAVEGIDQGADFAEGRELDRETAALVPVTAIGRLLDQEEAAKLICRLDREIPKRPAAASVRRMVKFAFESPWLVELRRRNSIPNIQAKAINWAMSPMRCLSS